MAIILCWSALGLGVGLFIGLLYRIKTTSPKSSLPHRQPKEIRLEGAEAIAAWAPVYTQATETLRDTVKLIVGANVAGLAACIAILGSDKGAPTGHLYASTMAFLLGLIFTIIPNAGLSEKYRDDAQAILTAIDADNTVPMPHPWPSGSRRYTQIFALCAIAFGIFFLANHFFATGAVQVWFVK
jgi:hypothetical protein